MAHKYIVLLAPFTLAGLVGCASVGEPAVRYIDAAALSDNWRTNAERTNYDETGRYEEVVDFCRRLAAASPYARYTSFGRSGEGRDLPLLILSRDESFTPEAAARSGKLVVLLQNCIHAGECAGKDASLELARDIVITGTRKDLLDQVNLLIMPIFSPDGHERFSPYSRINQNGPREMGWRVNAANLNLNRDYTKADCVGMRAWLRVWTAWQPDLFFDDHTTNGSDHQYVLFYSATANQLVAGPVRDWMSEVLLPSVLPALEADGNRTLNYGGPRDRTDLSKGINAYSAYSPRFSTGYSAICNRPSILVEVHALKPYAQRVRATYDIILHTLEELNRHPAALCDAIETADRETIANRGGETEDGKTVLRLEPTDEAEPVVYKAVESRVRASDITSSEIIEYSDRPLDVETQLYRKTRIAESITPPAAYLVPPQWTDVLDRLELHGIESFPLAHTARLAVESYRFEQVTFGQRPFEGRFQPSYKTDPVCETREFVAGTVVVPLAQKRAKVAVHLLEPDAPDSLIAWGFFNAIFEQKEYAESYVMEPIARKMLENDPELKREFEEKLSADEEFAKSPGARLNFFYRRSPYWDDRLNVYPVARLTDETVLEQLAKRAP
jgi:hypothetical protein